MAKLLKAPELAELLGICVATVWEWTRSGKIPVVRAGRLYRYDLAEVRKALTK